jgi:hypothetical protein
VHFERYSGKVKAGLARISFVEFDLRKLDLSLAANSQ